MSFIVGTIHARFSEQDDNIAMLSKGQKVTIVIDVALIIVSVTFAVLALYNINPIPGLTLTHQNAYIVLAAGSGGLVFVDLVAFTLHLARHNTRRVKAFRALSDTQITNLNAQINTLNTTNHNLTGGLKILEGDVNRLRGEIVAKEQAMATLHLKVIEDQKVQENRILETARLLETEGTQHAQQLAQLKEEIRVLNEQLGTKEGPAVALHEAEARLKALDAHIQEETSRFATAKQLNAGAQARLKELETEIGEGATHFRRAKAYYTDELKAKKTTLSKAESDCRDAVQRQQELQKTINEQTLRLDKLKEHIASSEHSTNREGMIEVTTTSKSPAPLTSAQAVLDRQQHEASQLPPIDWKVMIIIESIFRNRSNLNRWGRSS